MSIRLSPTLFENHLITGADISPQYNIDCTKILNKASINKRYAHKNEVASKKKIAEILKYKKQTYSDPVGHNQLFRFFIPL